MKDAAVMNVTVKGQAQLPKAWRESAGLKDGGAVRVVALDDGENSLLLTPIRKPRRTSKGLARLLASCPVEIPCPKRTRLPFK